MGLKIYEVANFHVKSRSDTVKHADADVGFSEFNTRYIRFALCAANHRSEFGLRQLLFQPELAYSHSEFL